jgi:hypothetical protein
MTENTTTPPKTIAITTLLYSDIVTIQVSGTFLSRIQSLLVAISDEVGKDELLKIFERLKANTEPLSTQEESVRILIALVHSIETAAKDQGKLTKKDYTPEEAVQIMENINLKAATEI